MIFFSEFVRCFKSYSAIREGRKSNQSFEIKKHFVISQKIEWNKYSISSISVNKFILQKEHFQKPTIFYLSEITLKFRIKIA